MVDTVEETTPMRTPLADVHEALGAHMVEFGGWWMPVQYSSILREHHAVRRRVGLFDLSHMGEVEVRGSSASQYLQRLVTNDVASLRDGQALYTPMCLPSGGIVDDLIVYRIDGARYLLIVNAANTEKDVRWMQEQAASDVVLEDRSDGMALLAVQGPKAREVVGGLADVPPDPLEPMAFMPDVTIAGVLVTLARTGYTGELGYELLCDAADAERLWHALYDAVRRAEGLPIGLGARDTLRLEARLMLYGNDLSEATTPLEAGLRWTVAFDKGDFVGSEALRRQQDDGVSRRLVGLRMDGRAIARAHYRVFRGDERIGEVSSGALSPTLGVNVGLAYVAREHAKIGRRVEVEVRQSRHAAEIVRTPFYVAPKP